ncbi:uncharacterized protein LOC109827287 [Asparagus officinalis]|uniref:uncharacterized protein LOC109827287 n=2 Tax=Asparagus officinalis TaxID=4686 RepID=UPI00098DE7E8|nr:uncharacterized protein LOC109827287 [Asparagus officinalis]
MRRMRRLFDLEGDRSRSITPGSGADDTLPSPDADAGYSSPGPSDAVPEPSPDAGDTWTPTYPSYTFHTDLRPKTQDYLSLPLPPASHKSMADARKYHTRAARKLEEMREMIETRKKVALAAKEREIANGAKKDRIENRRGGGKPDSKQPPRGMRAIIRWNSSNLPVGPWSTRLNAYIGVLVRRATIINPYFQFRELPWSAYEAIWTALMDCFCLEDFEGAWNYVFNVKVEVVLKQWRHEIKHETYDRYEEDWQRFLNLDARVDEVHFTALLMYWDSDASKNKSTKGSENRRKKLHDHHLGSHSYANLEDVYCQDTGKSLMPIHLRAKAAYGIFRDRYRGDEKNRDKIKANLELVEGFEAASKEAATVYMSQQEEQSEPDPHMLSAEDNITLTQHLMGHNRRGRYPLHGVGASPGVSMRSSTASSTAFTSMRAAPPRFQAMPFVARISAYLLDKIDSELHIQVTNEMTRVALTANSMDDLLGYVMQYLSGAIPHSAYGGVIRIISSLGDNSGAGQSSTQSGDIGGSSTRSRNQDRDTADDDDR